MKDSRSQAHVKWECNYHGDPAKVPAEKTPAWLVPNGQSRGSRPTSALDQHGQRRGRQPFGPDVHALFAVMNKKQGMRPVAWQVREAVGRALRGIGDFARRQFRLDGQHGAALRAGLRRDSPRGAIPAKL